MAGKPASAATTATQRVYDGIYQAIVEHRLAPGERLREAELAEGFAVSRTLVRQALHRLAQDQVIELQHNRGAMVPQPPLAQAVHVFDARRVVECEIARRLAGALDPERLRLLRQLVLDEGTAHARGDRVAGIRLSAQFHRELALLAGNPVFVRLLDELLPTTSLLMAQFLQPGQSACVAHRHEELLAALVAGPAASAAAEMRKHLNELEASLTRGPAEARPARRLRDVFSAYREGAAAPAPAKPARAPARRRAAATRAASLPRRPG
jgi:DNA-binding GntR family transcriptional regulator